jgi:hypothetical protein
MTLLLDLPLNLSARVTLHYVFNVLIPEAVRTRLTRRRYQSALFE